jgi:hypothetical protein
MPRSSTEDPFEEDATDEVALPGPVFEELGRSGTAE